MHENGINFLLVEKNNNNVCGIITEKNLLKGVCENSFKSSISKYITKVKKISHKFNVKKLISLMQSEDFLFIYEDKNFYGVINKMDILWYLKRKESHA